VADDGRAERRREVVPDLHHDAEAVRKQPHPQQRQLPLDVVAGVSVQPGRRPDDVGGQLADEQLGDVGHRGQSPGGEDNGDEPASEARRGRQGAKRAEVGSQWPVSHAWLVVSGPDGTDVRARPGR
jgi:hypothetical protein